MTDPTDRFSNRVDDYVKYRPSYPAALLDTLMTECRLSERSYVADIGAGTGIFASLLLDRRLNVIGVEPNQAMRMAADRMLTEEPGYTSRDGTAEATGISPSTIDLITAAQAFHWFEREKSRSEFIRILKPGGRMAIIWNDRVMDDSFQQDYESLLQEHGTDYNVVNHTNISLEEIERFFGIDTVQCLEFDNEHRLDLPGLIGRIQSSSYMPTKDDPRFPGIVRDAESIFFKHQQRGEIVFRYITRLYLGSFFRN